MGVVGVIVGIFVALLVVIVLQLGQLLQNQRAQMKQQFHSDAIALSSILGDEGLKKILDPTTKPEDLSPKESFATGLLIQRVIVGYQIRNAFTPEEWGKIVADARQVMALPFIREHWLQIKGYYTKDVQNFIDQTLMAVAK
jgi:hypothetical protein